MFKKLKKRLQKDSISVYPIPTEGNISKSSEKVVDSIPNNHTVTHVLSNVGKRRARRSMVEINLQLLNLLDKIPMTTHEVSVMSKLRLDTARTHLEYLEKLGKVERVSIPAIDKTLWRLRG